MYFSSLEVGSPGMPWYPTEDARDPATLGLSSPLENLANSPNPRSPCDSSCVPATSTCLSRSLSRVGHQPVPIEIRLIEYGDKETAALHRERGEEEEMVK